VRAAEAFGEDDAHLREALIVGLQAGEHEIELLVLHRGGESIGRDERVRAGQAVVLDVNRAIGAARERFTDDLGHARRPGRADHHLAAVLLLQAERFFERVGVRLVHLERGVLLADPGFRFVEAGLPLARGDLFDADRDLHALNLLNSSAALVPPKPKEFVSAYSMGIARALFGT